MNAAKKQRNIRNNIITFNSTHDKGKRTAKLGDSLRAWQEVVGDEESCSKNGERRGRTRMRGAAGGND
ncbi:hypothetical protein E2C01_100310 [Portunus trituberculatus]|uniref:Uncharacterized protein n=1 Tax=Portunus trituberculatus TaxID=210409 RepID=A0A5B7K7Q0_PORTR|nr:hypothetical protein [Portunus trituberculatus]